jgi:hypothetical protein
MCCANCAISGGSHLADALQITLGMNRTTSHSRRFAMLAVVTATSVLALAELALGTVSRWAKPAEDTQLAPITSLDAARAARARTATTVEMRRAA